MDGLRRASEMIQRANKFRWLPWLLIAASFVSSRAVTLAPAARAASVTAAVSHDVLCKCHDCHTERCCCARRSAPVSPDSSEDALGTLPCWDESPCGDPDATPIPMSQGIGKVLWRLAGGPDFDLSAARAALPPLEVGRPRSDSIAVDRPPRPFSGS